MRWWKTAYAGKNRGRGVLDRAKQQEIGHRKLVQAGRGLWLHANTIQSVAEDQPPLGLGIVKGLNPNLVMRAEERLALPIPDGETKVSQQVFEASLAPGSVGAKNQLSIAGASGTWVTGTVQCGEEVSAGIQPCVRHYPNLTVEAEGLLLIGGWGRYAEQGVTKSDAVAHPGLLGVRPAKHHEIRQRLQERAVRSFTLSTQHANNSAHAVAPERAYVSEEST